MAEKDVGVTGGAVMSRALLPANKPSFEPPAKTEGPEPLRGFPTPDGSVVFSSSAGSREAG